MTGRITKLIDHGLHLHAEIARLQQELELVEQDIVAAAKDGPHVDLTDEDREGKQFLATGTGKTVPVVFTADKLIGTFQFKSKTHTELGDIAGALLDNFYAERKTFSVIPRSGKSFRTLAGDLLGASRGPKFVTAATQRDKHGIPKSDIRVEWNRAAEIL